MRAWFLAVFAASVCACGPSATPNAPKPSRFHGPLLYYPIEVGAEWSYMLRDVLRGGPGLLSVTRVVSFDGTHAALRVGDQTIDLRVEPDGIVREKSNGYLLKVPFALGDTWKGAPGGIVVVTKVDVSVTVDAGTFEHCVETSETFRGDAPGTLATTYCPDVGPVTIDVRDVDDEGQPEEALAKLRSYGQAVDLGTKPSKARSPELP